MSREKAFDTALKLSVENEREAVVYGVDNGTFGAMLLEEYIDHGGNNFDIVTMFSNGIRMEFE